MSGERALLNTVIGRTAAAVLAATVALVLARRRGGDPGIRRRGRHQPRVSTPAVVPPARWGPPTAASTRSAAASARTTRAARSSSPPAPVPILMAGAILQKYESLGGPPTVTSAFPPSTRVAGKVSPAAATPRSARPTNPSSSGRRTPARTSCVARSTRRGTSSAARRGHWACRPRTRCSRATSSLRSSPAVNYLEPVHARSSPPCRPELAGQLAGLTVPDDATSAINAARRAAGGALGPLGAKQGQQYAIGPGRRRAGLRRRQDLLQPGHRRQRGQRPGSEEVRVRRRPAERPRLADEQRGRRRAEDGQSGQHLLRRGQPLIFWTPDYGAFIVRGAMNAAWYKLGGAVGFARASGGRPDRGRQRHLAAFHRRRSLLGQADEQVQHRAGQSGIRARRSDGARVTSRRAEPSAAAPNSNDRNWFTPSWWWLLAGIPLLVLVGLILVATLRRRGGDDRMTRWTLRLRRRHRP